MEFSAIKSRTIYPAEKYKKPHAERASMHCDTKAEAVDLARDICKGSWIVTRRGYVVPLDKGKEGIHKKFDEILSTCAIRS